MENDELLQIQTDTFHRIVVGIGVVGAVSALAAIFFDGFGSPWLIRAIGLIIAAAVAYAVSMFRRAKVASYVLVFQLVALTLAAFFQPDFLDSTIPYLFIPVVIIAGMLLQPKVSLGVAAGLIVAALLANVLLFQAAVAELGQLVFPLGLTAMAALLTVINTRNLMLYDDRLLENRSMLKSRSLELMQAMNRLETLEQKSAKLEQEVQAAQTVTGQLQSDLSQKLSLMMTLADGSVGNLNEAISELEAIIEQLADAPALNGQRQLIDDAWHRLYRLRSFVINLDELTQMEQDSFELDISEVDINRLLMDVAGATQGLVRGEEMEIRVHPAEGLPSVSADPNRLRQVLLHLVNNAIKFTDAGLIELRAEQDDRQVVVMVADTGIGMTSEEASHAFDLFGRGDNPSLRDRQGSGLGLAISRQLIELHGGRMWVTSEPDRGSIFYFSLPVKASPQPMYGSSYAKTTLRLGMPEAVKAKIEQAAAAPVAAAAGSRAQTVSARAPEARHTPAQPVATDPGVTQPMPVVRPAVASEDNGETLILRQKDTGRHQRFIQPIHRFQPMYIQRFGFILLGLLAIVVTVVAFLAIVNYASGVPAIATPPTVQSEATSASPDDAASAAVPDEATPAVAAAVSASATPSPSPPAASATPAVAAVKITVTSTPPPPTPAFTATPTASPTPRPTQPPATATNTATSAPATPLSEAALVLPTSTPAGAAAPATAAVEIALSPTASPTPLIVFAGGSGSINLATGGARPALSQPVEPNSRVSLSSSGQLAYSGLYNGGRDVFVAGPDGQATNLTNAPADDIQPAWSPDGQQVVFSSGRTGSFKIFSMGADGSDTAQLTEGRGFDEWPAWSPDGQQVAFVSDRDGNAEIYVMAAAGGSARRLTDNRAEDWPVSWSPDGSWLVFGSNRDGNWNLYMVPAAGGAPTQLTSHPADERDPVWLPGGDIAFAHNGPGNWDIFTLTAAASQSGPVAPEAWTQVTDTPQDERYPALVIGQ